ncbi:MAG: isoaspartyl peptidase/L-asparaginase [Deltaproteobacteria bacterium]|nr:MAG: isoaspartyl peptidase/L-asparaginase [Deltaproteobacteria bacterium]
MSYAGELTKAEFDRLLDRRGGPAVLVHGGAGTRVEDDPALYFAGTKRAAEAGLRVLLQGGSPLDAAQAAALVLEDDPQFNAGTGAALTSAGEVELDASCMDGTTLRAGAVACVKTIQNPILAARRVCDDTPHVLICGPGAEVFARESGIPQVENASLITPRQRARWEELHEQAQKLGADSVRKKIGTIGAVAVDAHGHLAACSSTGGTMYKRPGRVGDTPIIGAGTYADDHEAAASSTGLGEAILKVTLARAACLRVREGDSPRAAAIAAVGLLRERAHGDGGIIIAGPDGRLGWAYNTPRMSRAFIREGMSSAKAAV